MANIRESNLLWRIESCLKEHQVNIAVGRNKVPFYLIMQERIASPITEDFAKTYPEATDFQRQLAERILTQSAQTYGIFVDTNLKYSFAFNRKFADLNKKKDGIDFKSAEDVLLGTFNQPSQPIFPISDFPDGPFFPHDGPGSDLTVRYAITGGKGSNCAPANLNVNLSELFGRASLLDNVKKDYTIKGLKINLADERGDFFLTYVDYSTNRLQDFEATYGSSGDEIRNRLAKKLFANEKIPNRYGVILDNDLKMRFAFNTRFAEYNIGLNKVVYTPEIDLLVPATSMPQNPQVFPKYGFPGPKPKPKPDVDFPGNVMKYGITPPKPSGGSGPVFRYAIVGKKKK